MHIWSRDYVTGLNRSSASWGDPAKMISGYAYAEIEIDLDDGVGNSATEQHAEIWLQWQGHQPIGTRSMRKTTFVMSFPIRHHRRTCTRMLVFINLLIPLMILWNHGHHPSYTPFVTSGVVAIFANHGVLSHIISSGYWWVLLIKVPSLLIYKLARHYFEATRCWILPEDSTNGKHLGHFMFTSLSWNE